MVIKGNAPINPPSLSFLFATSDIITTTSAVVRYLVIIQDKAAPYYFSKTLNNFIKIRPINHQLVYLPKSSFGIISPSEMNLELLISS